MCNRWIVVALHADTVSNVIPAIMCDPFLVDGLHGGVEQLARRDARLGNSNSSIETRNERL